MKRLFIALLLMLTIYAAKPYWEQPVSHYINLDFLAPVDAGIEKVVTHAYVEKSIGYVSNAIDDIFYSLIGQDGRQNSSAANTIARPLLQKPESGQIAVFNIEIGTPYETVVERLGLPSDSYPNEYDTLWHTHHDNYQHFFMISYDDMDRVNGLYTNQDLISSEDGLAYGSSKEEVRAVYGEPLTELRKGINVFLLNDSEEFDLFETKDMYVYFFYDLHRNNQVTALQMISKELESKRSRIYANESDRLRQGFERQLFDLTNAARVQHGRLPLSWDEETATIARNHSQDMATHHFFSHENLQGLTPFERMKEAGIQFRAAGENLAYGQSSSVFAHEGLMNSVGHRENILLDTYRQLGVGVSFNEEAQPYYTSKFLLK